MSLETILRVNFYVSLLISLIISVLFRQNSFEKNIFIFCISFLIIILLINIVALKYKNEKL